MVELESCNAAVVAAQRASSTGFEHKLSFDATTLVRHVLDSASSATKAFLTAHMASHAVSRTRDLRGAQACRERGFAKSLARHSRGREAMSAQPRADRRRTAVEDVRHVADRELAANDLGEQFPFDPAALGVTRCVRRRQAVLACPVRDGRGVAVDLPCDRLDRLPARQPLR